MVLKNATKRARNSSSYIASADNRCNAGMKKAGAPPYAGWMRSLNGVHKHYYFSRTSKNYLYQNPTPRDGKQVLTCTKPGASFGKRFFLYRPVMAYPFASKHMD